VKGDKLSTEVYQERGQQSAFQRRSATRKAPVELNGKYELFQLQSPRNETTRAVANPLVPTGRCIIPRSQTEARLGSAHRAQQLSRAHWRIAAPHSVRPKVRALRKGSRWQKAHRPAKQGKGLQGPACLVTSASLPATHGTPAAPGELSRSVGQRSEGFAERCFPCAALPQTPSS